MSDTRKIQIVSVYLRGIATNWYQQMCQLNDDWPINWTGNNDNAFSHAFLSQFRTNVQIMSWQQQLATRVQEPNEPVAQYANDIKALLNKIDYNNAYPEFYKVCEFVKELNN